MRTAELVEVEVWKNLASRTGVGLEKVLVRGCDRLVARFCFRTS